MGEEFVGLKENKWRPNWLFWEIMKQEQFPVLDTHSSRERCYFRADGSIDVIKHVNRFILFSSCRKRTIYFRSKRAMSPETSWLSIPPICDDYFIIKLLMNSILWNRAVLWITKVILFTDPKQIVNFGLWSSVQFSSVPFHDNTS